MLALATTSVEIRLPRKEFAVLTTVTVSLTGLEAAAFVKAVAIYRPSTVHW